MSYADDFDDCTCTELPPEDGFRIIHDEGCPLRVKQRARIKELEGSNSESLEEKGWLFKVGKRKGEWDFSLSAIIGGLTLEEYSKFQQMLSEATYRSHDMWLRYRTEEGSKQLDNTEGDTK